jgi:hypothetical protein
VYLSNVAPESAKVLERFKAVFAVAVVEFVLHLTVAFLVVFVEKLLTLLQDLEPVFLEVVPTLFPLLGDPQSLKN